MSTERTPLLNQGGISSSRPTSEFPEIPEDEQLAQESAFAASTYQLHLLSIEHRRMERSRWMSPGDEA